MSKVFVVDNTEGYLYYNTTSMALKGKAEVELEYSADRATNKISTKLYNVIILSNGSGKTDLMDLADSVRHSRINSKAVVIVVEDNPTRSMRAVGALKGKRIYKFKSSQMDELKALLERILL